MAAQENSGAQAWRPLPGYDVLAARGPQAAAFLHAQFATDLVGLGDGCWHWTCWMDAKGRVLVLCIVVRLTTDEFRLVVPFGRGSETAANLSRFVFRSKVALGPEPRVACSGRIGARGVPTIAPHAGGTIRRDDHGLEFALGGCVAREIRLSTDQSDVAGQRGHDAGWLGLDIADGIPWIAPSATAAFTPQALSLERLGAYELGKGCYPGQEIVARTHWLGRGKRRLGRFECDSGVLPQAGSAVVSAAAQAAAVVLAERRGDGRIDLLVSVHEDAGDLILADGRTLRPLPLA